MVGNAVNAIVKDRESMPEHISVALTLGFITGVRNGGVAAGILDEVRGV
jgi:hypothetical protein